MSATYQQYNDAVPTQTPTELALVVELDPAENNALLRVLNLLARRRCSVVGAAFAPDPEAGCDRLRLELEVPHHLDRNVIAWLSALVPVRSVHLALAGTS